MLVSQSVDIFLDAPADKKEGIRARVKDYMERAELIKKKVKEEKEGTCIGPDKEILFA